MTRMSAGRVVFLGGTGVISSACVDLAVERGWDVSVVTRGRTSARGSSPVKSIVADVTDQDGLRAALSQEADVVCDFLSFGAADVTRRIDLLDGRVGQYVFISSASAYQTPPRSWPITESTPLRNPFWDYSRGKIACENALIEAHRERDFPVTIVRPSHTYDRTKSPLVGGLTALKRIIEQRPVVLHGDGSSLWTLTHASDFAKGFVGLFGRPAALGEAFHVTGEEWLSWWQIASTLAAAAGVELHAVTVSSQRIAEVIPSLGDGLLGDKTHSMIFDTSKVKRFVPDFVCTTPFSQGAAQIVAYYAQHPDALVANPEWEAGFDALIAG